LKQTYLKLSFPFDPPLIQGSDIIRITELWFGNTIKMSQVFFWQYECLWTCFCFLVHTHCVVHDNASPLYAYSSCRSFYI